MPPDQQVAVTNASAEPDRAFMLAQFDALRAEILATQRRAFQTMTAGIVGLPILNFIIQARAAGPSTTGTAQPVEPYIYLLIIGLPVVVIVVALLYLADNNAVIRAGCFIRWEIEPALGCRSGHESSGWEYWLENNKPATRATERYVTTAVYILFLLYYISAVDLAWSAVSNVFTPFGSSAVRVGYVVFGTVVAVYFVRELLLSTKALEKRVRQRAEMARIQARVQSFATRRTDHTALGTE
jgi:hypothetical protein